MSNQIPTKIRNNLYYYRKELLGSGSFGKGFITIFLLQNLFR